MASSKLVSIIVPVYNTEKYLSRCISSILQQTHKLIEVILVDDGSTDDSGLICSNYAKRDQRVRVIHQQNAGPSAARNHGIRAATGDYIQFVDADDYLEPTMTARLVEAMNEGAQLVICGYTIAYKTMTRAITPSIIGNFSQTAFINHIGELYKNIILPSPCNKLYQAALINDKAIRFDSHFNIGEDLLFNLAYSEVCEQVTIIDEPLYTYCINRYSLTKAFKKDLMKNQQVLLARVKDFLRGKNCFTKDNQYFLSVIQANSIVNGLNNIFHPQSPYTQKQKKQAIISIISSSDVHMAHFSDSLQSRLVGNLVKNNDVSKIYWFFTIKNLLHQRLQPVFHLLKRLN
ncbi:glycosyltransferase family 2 protein [Lentibacillus sp. N15]|uniref:glycosyltransferase family 2 protein n=1 Tax=Lentibacillus songyuanensis TaxID=3136161 RepID=UPI0031BB6E47